MKEITIKFVGTGYLKLNQAKIWIYDIKGNLICKANTFNGKIKVCLKKKCFYKVIAQTKYGKDEKTFYVNNQNNYIFAFNYSYIVVKNKFLVTFHLTDYYYANLPIEKGEIYVWQR